MFLRAKSSSERNFAVQVVRHLFKPHELDGRNVRGVNGKLPLDSTKLEKVRQLVLKFIRYRCHANNLNGETAEKQ